MVASSDTYPLNLRGRPCYNYSMTGGKVKLPIPNQLTSKGLTLDGLSTFWSLLSNWVRQEPNYQNFLPGGEYEHWIAKKVDKSRGITVQFEEDPNDETTTETNRRNASAQAVKIASQLEDFLSTVASKCPDGMFRTIVNEATSMEWILRRIRTAFRLQSKGINLYDATKQGYDEEADGSYDVAYMKLKDMYEDLLLPQGSKYHGINLETDEALTPLSESFIVIQWLNSIDPRLPKHIKENRTQWFNDDTPTWADIQSLIVDNIETLLLECNKTADDSSDSARIGRFNSSRKRENHVRKTYNSRPQSSNKFCEICKNAGKEERIYTSHWVTRCNSLSNAAKQACAKASLRALLADDEVFSDPEEVSDSSDI